MKTAYLVAGLAYGDEGKGATVDYLVRKHQAGLVVRYNGGAQAAHNVVSPDGKHHTFAQFGSGTLVGVGTHTHLSRHVIVNPISMIKEAEHLTELGVQNIWGKISVEEDALIVTPFQAAANRIIENYRKQFFYNEHGSCGLGIGQTRGDYLKFGDKVLFAKDLRNELLTKEKLQFIRGISYDAVHDVLGTKLYPSHGDDAALLVKSDAIDWCWEKYKNWQALVVHKDVLSYMLENTETVVFEGAQGMLIDEKFGVAPYNTWTDITYNNANELLAESCFDGEVKRVGVLRSYFTRHGAGPFPTEDKSLCYSELHNNAEGFQGSFRLGHFDWVQARFAKLAIGGIDILALNHLDLIPKPHARLDFAVKAQQYLNASYIVASVGPTADDRISGRAEALDTTFLAERKEVNA